VKLVLATAVSLKQTLVLAKFTRPEWR